MPTLLATILSMKIFPDRESKNPRNIWFFVHTNGMHVYFFMAGEFIKIGKAHDIEKRRLTIQACCPLPIEVIGSVRCSTNAESLRLESHLHKTIGWKHAHHEWFHAPADAKSKVVEIIHEAQRSLRSSKVGVKWVYGLTTTN